MNTTNLTENSLEQFSFFADGGPFVWVIVAIGFFGIVFLIERTLYLHRGQIRAATFLDGICNNLRSGRYVEALTVCEETPGPVARVVKAILLHANEGESRMRIAAEQAAVLEIPSLERRAGTLRTLAAVAPLVGFAGTVFELLHAFLLMKSEGHYASADLFSGGIAEALAATGLGIVVCIILTLGHHFVLGRIRAITHDIEKTGIDLISFICYESDVSALEKKAPAVAGVATDSGGNKAGK
ncbi:MAG: MotA/TolQ/ExbB proton channel family protein [Opitutae bacterium]|nr:MotA/TolQ/ExbB proton channel family protein [Opitutae bacterium]